MIALRCHDKNHAGHMVPLRDPYYWELQSEMLTSGVFLDKTFCVEHVFSLSDAREAGIYQPSRLPEIDSLEDKMDAMKSAEE